MATTDSATNIFIEAKSEYTRELISIIKPHIFTGIKSLYDDSRITCKKKNDVSKTLFVFQNQLKSIPQWNQNILNEEVNRIIKTSQCEWLEDLVTAVFISHIKILSSIRGDTSTINLKVPKSDAFIHQCYIEVAREIWKNPYLFLDKGNKLEYMANLREVDTIIAQCISETLRKMLPIKNIVKDYILTGTGNTHTHETSMTSINDEKKSMDKNVIDFINNNRDTIIEENKDNISTINNQNDINNTISDNTFYIQDDVTNNTHNNIDFKKIDEDEIKTYFIKDDTSVNHNITDENNKDTLNNDAGVVDDNELAEDDVDDNDDVDIDADEDDRNSDNNLDIDIDNNLYVNKDKDANVDIINNSILNNDNSQQSSNMWISSKITNDNNNNNNNIIMNIEHERELELKKYADNNENKIDNTIESTLTDFIYENKNIHNDIDTHNNDTHTHNDIDIHTNNDIDIHTHNDIHTHTHNDIDIHNDTHTHNDIDIHNHIDIDDNVHDVNDGDVHINIHKVNNGNNVNGDGNGNVNTDSDNNYESDCDDDMISIAGGDTYNNRYINNDKIIVQKVYSDMNNRLKKLKIITPTHKDKFVSKKAFDETNADIKNIFLLPKNYKKDFKFA